MSSASRLTALVLALGLAAPAGAATPPALHCRHPLATTGAAADLPASVAAQLRPWMALHGERWNGGDSISRGDLTSGFLWAAHGNGNWVVAYTVGGISCCHTRFALFTPAAPGSAGYRWIMPTKGAPDYFGDASCGGLDAALDAYGARR
jgi:hypothetical protein